MFKKTAKVTIAILLFSLVFSSIAMATENITYTYNFTHSVQQDYFVRNQLNSLFITYYRTGLVSGKIYDIEVSLRDFTGDKNHEVAVITHTVTGEKHLDIFTGYGQKMIRIFSGKGDLIKLNFNSFSISNVKYDGRYYNETYTYKWRNGKFLRTGYAKTYIRDDGYYEIPIKDKPIKIIKDERAFAVNSLLKARMQGNYDFAMNYLSKAYKEKFGSKDMRSLIPYGQVTTVDIFESQRGDWVVAVIRDYWGQSRVFKFVPTRKG